MRSKYLNKFLVIIFILFSFINTFASTNTFVRSENDLRIHDSIDVNVNNINNILNTPSVDENEKVYDFANLFSDNEESLIYNKINSFINKSNYDLAVVTINVNNKYDEVEYADDFYDYNYFGFDESFSGLLILIDMDNRVVYLSTTGYAIKMYDDYRIDRVIDAGYDYLVLGEYYDSVINMIDELEYYYDSGYPESNENLVIDGTDVYYKKTIFDYLKWPLIVSLIITVIISIIMYNKTRLKIKAINVASYITSEKNININKQFIRTSVTRVPINTGSSSGGSSGGGSSSHRSSSGRSHGGGGRRF